MCLSISPLSLSQTALYKGGSCGGIGPHNRKVAAGWEGQGQAISSAYTRHSRGTLPSLTLPPLSWTAWGPGELLTFSGRSLRSPPRCGRAAATGGQQRSVRAFSREAASERLWSMRSACWPAKAVCLLASEGCLPAASTCAAAPSTYVQQSPWSGSDLYYCGSRSHQQREVVSAAFHEGPRQVIASGSVILLGDGQPSHLLACPDRCHVRPEDSSGEALAGASCLSTKHL